MAKPKRIKHRLMGSESDLGYTCRIEPSQIIDPHINEPVPVTKLFSPFFERVGKYFVRPLGSDVAGAQTHNMGRAYYDNVPEYATPECRGAKELVCHEIAGLEYFQETIESLWSEYPFFDGLNLNKNQRDGLYFRRRVEMSREDVRGAALGFSIGINPRGSHANYLTFSRITNEFLGEALGLFLKTRFALIGNGWLDVVPGGGIRFLRSQRAPSIVQLHGTCSTLVEKPLIHRRDEMHCDPSLWRRIHDISGDSNMSPFQLFLKYVTYDLVLAMVEEEGYFVPPPQIEDVRVDDLTFQYENGQLQGYERKVGRVISFFNSDIFSSSPVVLDDGRRWLDIDFQEYYLSAAEKFFADGNGPLTEDRRLGLRCWRESLDALRRRNLDYLGSRHDWAIIWKYLISGRLEKLGYNPELVIRPDATEHTRTEILRHDIALDGRYEGKSLLEYLLEGIFEYSNLNKRAGLYYHLERRGCIEPFIGQSKIDFAKTTPPGLTRAKWRDLIFRAVKEKYPDLKFDNNSADWWTRIRFKPAGSGTHTITFSADNPYQCVLKMRGRPIEECADDCGRISSVSVTNTHIEE